MTDERVEEVLFGINGKLSSIETKLDSMGENILKHESRLTQLESKVNTHLAQSEVKSEVKSDDSFKTDMMKLLGKCLVIALTSIATLVGSGSLLMKVLGQ